MSTEPRLVIASDGLLARRVGNWSNEKLFYLRRYCDIFNSGMKNKWGCRVFIDLFSGPGRCIIDDSGNEIDGSPLIAANSDPGFTHLILNDMDPAAVAALRQRLQTDGKSVYLTNGDCNAVAETITGILDSLWPSSQLSVCFVDPTGWQVDLATIARLTKGRRMDLIVVFQIGYMKRFAYLKPPQLTRFFGDDSSDPEWFRLYEANGRKGRGLTPALLGHYRGRLEMLGYSAFHDEVIVEQNNDGPPLYHMLFASKSPRGEDFWQKIARRQHDGQMRMPL